MVILGLQMFPIVVVVDYCSLSFHQFASRLGLDVRLVEVGFEDLSKSFTQHSPYVILRYAIWFFLFKNTAK
jgi:hypothetical protein